MTGVGDARVEAAMRAALREGPRDVVSLADAVLRREGDLLAKREGLLHAVLRRAMREGRIHVAGRSAAGLGLYGLEPKDGTGPSALDVAIGAAKASRVARRMERAVRDPAERVRVRMDVLAHVAAIEAAGKERSFGSPKAAAHALKRADRGRPFVATAAGGRDHVARFVLNEGAWIAGAIVAFFVVRWFLLGVYVIPSPSMVPTLQIGDRVVAWLPGGAERAQRWDIVTFDVGKTTFVKRLVGLPGESIAIVDGDVWVDGTILVKPDDVREALRFPEARFDFTKGDPPGWQKRVQGDSVGWTLMDVRSLRDVYVDVDVDRPAGGYVRLFLTRGRSTGQELAFVDSLEVSPKGARVYEMIQGAEDGDEHAETDRPPAAGRIRVSMSCVDGVLRAKIPGFHHREERHVGPGPTSISISAERGTRILAVTIDRDVHYSYDWTLAVPQPSGSRDPKDYAFRIPAGRVFMLGDNTTSSSDSRNPQTMGPVPIEEIHGPVRFRIWPPSRIGPVR